MWQDLRTRWHAKGLEVVTVALDVNGVDAAGPFIDKAKAEHPSLIDRSHVLGELFGVVNVPTGLWIDEDGTIVRPPEVAFPGVMTFRERLKGVTLPDDLPPDVRHALDVTARLPDPDAAGYLAAIEDWIEHGRASRFALAPEVVVARSRGRTEEDARAAAHFELGQHLHLAGFEDDAVAHFREAHRLAPRNWTYKRQAWSFVDPVLQAPREVYGTTWAEELERLGVDTYHEPLDL